VANQNSTVDAVALAALRAAFGKRLHLEEALARHTSARIGGPADLFLVAETLSDLREAARIAWDHDLQLFVLGGGSNILVSDAGVRGLVVANRARGIEFEAVRVRAESGVNLSTLARRCIGEGLAGLEWAIGVPGTVGGAVVGNAGAHGGDMAGCVESARVLQSDDVERAWSNAELAFAYRTSAIKRNAAKSVILDVALMLKPEPTEAIQARADEYNAYRKSTQPPGASIGSMFKNPPEDYAGRLIDQVGLKGKVVGKAQISPVHANFFVNLGDARGADVYALIDKARRAVLAQFGVRLELEVQLVGDWALSGEF
jgi:UDP-N-acetylmuramate dehydrogenase